MRCRCCCVLLGVVSLPVVLGGLLLLGPWPASAQEGESHVAAKPGPEHAVLAKLAGEWEATTHFRMGPGGPADVSRGTETVRLRYGGLWLLSVYKGEFAGQPFEGQGTLGYDQTKRKYVGTWIDSMTSGLGLMEGTFDARSKTFTFQNTSTDPQTGEKMDYTSKHVIQDDDHHVFSMYMKGPDGKEFESMRVEYARKGAKKRTDALAAIVGNWKMLVKYQEDGDAADYDLRITRAAGGLAAVLVSPRSGEHKFKSAAWKDGVLELAIERTIRGQDMEIHYKAKFGEAGLSGEFTIAGIDDFTGTWSATKETKE